MNRLYAAAVIAALTLSFARADDWPQWRGPNRDEISKEVGIQKTWPSQGPPVAWTFTDAGIGYSGPAVVGNRLYIAGATGEGEDDKDFVLCIDTGTGKQVWKADFGKGFKNGWGGGPRGNPTVDGDSVYVLGPKGELLCLATADGKQKWSKDFVGDLGGKIMSGWGYSESVLVDGDRVICTPGGSRGTLAALDKTTGKVVWRSTDLTDDAAYSSVIKATVGGVAMYVQQTNKGVVGVNAKTGKLLWKNDCPAYRTAVIPTPVFHDDHVYVSSGYGAGCTLVKLTADGKGGVTAKEVYKNKNMINHHGGVVLVGDYIYGFSDGRGWVCQDFKTGENKWEAKGKNQLEKGSITCVDGDLLCYGESSGQLVRIKATPEGWKEVARFKLPKETRLSRKQGKIWTHPVVANGKLYLRDLDLLFAFNVSDSTARR
jgi:outer membrane protein assembly factor BamB